jgi:membrane protein
VAFLLLVSLVLTAALSAFGDVLGGMLPEGLSATLLQVINQVVSFAVIAALFAAIFKVLPDATAAWRDVWVGAAVTAFLFVVGKFLIGFYLGRSNPGEAFGAAGSLAVMLVWIYYSSMILLFGAEFTQAWAEARGGGIAPERGAVRVVQEKKAVRDGRTVPTA